MAPNSYKKIKLYPVILCGGTGNRLWPSSRESLPKQFQKFFFEKTLFQQTITRIRKLECEAPVIVSNEKYLGILEEQLAEIHCTPEVIILEPISKNTTAAITLAAIALADRHAQIESDDTLLLMLVLPADHIIYHADAFIAAIEMAIELAKHERLITFGIEADYPATGYGYIQAGTPHNGVARAFSVKSFTEKPDLATANDYLTQGHYYWNSGIFLFPVSLFLSELSLFRSDDVAHTRLSLPKNQVAASINTDNIPTITPDKNAFSKIKSESIDYALMENTALASVIPVSMGWSDVGSWTALQKYGQQDENGNVLVGDILTFETKNSYISSNQQLTATIGINNMIVVVTEDAVLIADKSHDQEVNKVVASLKQSGRKEAFEHTKTFRPWGWYKVVAQGPQFEVRELMIKPNRQVGLQRHQHRSENWIVAHGIAKCIVDKESFVLEKKESILIKNGQTHRLINPGKIPLHIIEVRTGDYLGEDDIERLENE